MAGIAVFVDSRGGNTRKVADAIAEELDIPVGDITASLPGDAGILFLGSGTYGGKPGEAMTKFHRVRYLLRPEGRPVRHLGSSRGE